MKNGNSDADALARTWSGLVGQQESDEIRVDRYLAEVARVLSRSQLKARGALIRVNGKEAKPSRILKGGDRIELSWTDEPSPGLEGEDLPLAILYEDDRTIVLDKAQGMVTHPGHGNRRGTLANALLWRLQHTPRRDDDFPTVRAAERAGIVHRLDKDTSGLMIAAKDAEAQAFLAAQFKDRLARKEYMAITRGVPAPTAGRISDFLGRDKRDRKRFAPVSSGGKAAITDYRVLATWDAYALVSLRPRTGRTHQLRVHMAKLGTPILGDPIYGKRDPRFPEAMLMLHSYRLKILLPGAESPSLFRASVPERFKAMLRVFTGTVGEGKRPDGDAQAAATLRAILHGLS